MVRKILSDFNIEQIADSGQCFRMKKIDDNKYYTIAFDRYLEITKADNNTYEFSCSEEEFESIWEKYFDLSTDYSVFKSNIDNNDICLQNAVEFGYGIRILKQDLWEVIVSFIISQRKSIPAISTCIESLSKAYGKKIEYNNNTYYSFPSPDSLAKISLDELLTHGLGYRAKYISNISKEVALGNIDLNELRTLPYDEAYKKLMSIYGVGAKIANCVLLFGLYQINAFPKDVWINRIIENEYNGSFDEKQYDGYAGVIQQYMFYYKRFN